MILIFFLILWKFSCLMILNLINITFILKKVLIKIYLCKHMLILTIGWSAYKEKALLIVIIYSYNMRAKNIRVSSIY